MESIIGISIGSFGGLGRSFPRKRRSGVISALMSGEQAYPGQLAQLLADQYDKESQAVNKAKNT